MNLLTPSIRPEGAVAETGPLPFDAHKDVSAKEERKTPVELAWGTASEVVENVIGRIEEAVEITYLK
jgi:hypothetical protein